MIRVLHELSALDGGGVAKLLFDYYSHMDKSKVHFDFVIYNFYAKGIFEEPLEEMGCTIYKIPKIKDGKRAYMRNVKSIIAKGNYDIVHCHSGCRGLFVAYYAKRYGVKTRIVHSHIANEVVTAKMKMVNQILCFLTKRWANVFFACGEDAGLYMWGHRVANSGKLNIMVNAIDTNKFKFSYEERIRLRKELQVEDKLVFGIVGRMSEQKNYPFLFEIMKEMIKLNNNVVLIVVGRGLEEEKIKQNAMQLGIEKYVKFLGVRNDVPILLNAMDAFILPSLYEGLPVVLVEAQANGLKEFVSNSVTKEVAVTDLISYISLEKNPAYWAKQILNADYSIEQRRDYAAKVRAAGYEIVVASKELEDYYCKQKYIAYRRA